MKYCNNFEYDLKLGQIKEKELGYIFDNKTIEVKTDLKASETGRVFVEYENRCRQLLNTELDVKGGDNNTSKGILLPVLQLCINI